MTSVGEKGLNPVDTVFNFGIAYKNTLTFGQIECW